MPDSRHKACYGAMFPSVLTCTSDKPSRGKVFAYQLLMAGGMWRSGRGVAQDLAEWDDCLDCPEFDHCYKFCVARLMLEAAISDK